jgi:hypothetical protein
MRAIRSFADANEAIRISAGLLDEIVKRQQEEGRLRREIGDLETKLPKLRSALADQEKGTAMIKAQRQEVEDALVEAETRLR